MINTFAYVPTNFIENTSGILTALLTPPLSPEVGVEYKLNYGTSSEGPWTLMAKVTYLENNLNEIEFAINCEEMPSAGTYYLQIVKTNDLTTYTPNMIPGTLTIII